METRRGMVPGIVTVSRDTGRIIGVERVEADEKAFRELCRWLLEMHGMHGTAEKIREAGLRAG